MRFLRKVILCLFLVFSLVTVVFAGNIDSTEKNAKFLNSSLGKINFGTTEGNVEVTNTAVTGYAWSQTLGWINLAPSNSGVVNNGSGTLSGYAWGEGTGWINFAPTNGGVYINNTTGVFTGHAWSENAGWISFNCSDESVCGSDDYVVKTSWKKSSGGATTSTEDSTPTPVDPPDEDPDPAPVPPTPEPTPEPDVSEDPSDEGKTDAGPSDSTDSSSTDSSSSSSSVTATVKKTVDKTIQVVKDTIDDTKDFIANDPVGVVSTRVVSTTGAVTGTLSVATSILVNPLSFTEMFTLPLRLWTLLLSLLGLKKKYKPWGTVYDSVTKQPIDPAYVVLKDLNGKEVSTAITDIDGRYGFLMQPGSYVIEANKTNYTFPSKQLAGVSSDELYPNLYFGGELNIDEENAVIAKNIPMDPIKFDWNEFAKKDKKLMRFYSKFDVLFSRFVEIAFVLGFVISLIALFAAPAPYNLIVFGVYVILMALRIMGLKPKRNGHITDKETNNPLSFAIIKIYAEGVNQPIVKKITDAYGRYFCLVPKGDYYVTVEKKNPDQSYSHVFTSGKVSAQKGIIHEDFKVI